MTRKLARIVKIDNLLPIEGADRISCTNWWLASCC